jgi:hypothetical protein
VTGPDGVRISGPWDAYRWVSTDPRMDAFCIAVIPSTDAAVAIDAYACNFDSRRDALFAEQFEMAVPYPQGGGNDTVQIDQLEHVVVAVEANGWAGTEDPRPAELSRSGTYVAVYENVNALMQVVVARQGRVERRFDPFLYDVEGALPEETGLPFDKPELADSAMLLLVERLTGVRLTQGWVLEQPHPAYTRDPSPPRATLDH